MNDELQKLVNEHDKAKMVAQIAKLEVAVAFEKIRAACMHDKEDLEIKSDYFPGSYSDTAYTDRWNQCKVCGAKSVVERTSHGYYG